LWGERNEEVHKDYKSSSANYLEFVTKARDKMDLEFSFKTDKMKEAVRRFLKYEARRLV